MSMDKNGSFSTKKRLIFPIWSWKRQPYSEQKASDFIDERFETYFKRHLLKGKPQKLFASSSPDGKIS